MTNNRALIIINKPARQGGNGFSNPEEIFRDHGIEPNVVFIDAGSQIEDIIEDHAERVDRIIIGGGDGTLNAALESVLSSGHPLGLLPMGTANDLARTLNISFDLAEAARVIVKGKVHKIDLGWVNGKHF